MLGDRLGESRGQIIGARVLPSEGQQIWMEVSFQGHGTLLGQEINDTGTYRQTVRPGGVLYGEGHVLMMSAAGDIVDWVGGGVGRTDRSRVSGQLWSVAFSPDNFRKAPTPR
jgi:hypothetical protein